MEVDYCPQCRGIWLDRGELDKLIERSERPATEDFGRDEHWPRREDRHRYSSEHHEDSANYPKGDRCDQRPRKRESWFSDLFDWD
ncbi:MAG: zf-TFIIB domain-containing protein [Planctomycetaceae bacterium]